ncbi:flagellar export chaperone FliS [Rhodoferax koreense]|uniref:Flagellar secretion chaperone FliS n=1 Tax=Rhodoferax koreensis TaxID=1842727 RepID=A0A1P8K3A9_9BURK|nr:flagellar export chaperone FliS [Rhodoferax koreense]APW40477.1 flagellar export chaperone FliS [Rhodoferax koreense]
MFTPVSTRSASAYKRVGVETSIDGASPHQLICLLFDALLLSLAKARGALERNDMELKGKEISRAVRILEEGLKDGLNKEQGGELAVNLLGVYNYSISRLTMANVKNDAALIGEVSELIKTVFEAWKSIATPVAHA